MTDENLMAFATVLGVVSGRFLLTTSSLSFKALILVTTLVFAAILSWFSGYLDSLDEMIWKNEIRAVYGGKRE